jgi:RNA polymerase sigma-70 factor (ECF subfamily)
MGRRARGAQLEELERLYREQAPRLRRLAAAIVGEREAALDVVQQAFATAVRQRSKFRGEGPLEAWLWRIVVREARAQSRARHDLPLEATFSSNGHEPDAAVAVVRAALASLPERQRLAVFLRHYADLDYVTIADVLGITPGTVGAALNAAHARLAQVLEEVPR